MQEQQVGHSQVADCEPGYLSHFYTIFIVTHALLCYALAANADLAAKFGLGSMKHEAA
jgi:hypothetical protein